MRMGAPSCLHGDNLWQIEHMIKHACSNVQRVSLSTLHSFKGDSNICHSWARSLRTRDNPQAMVLAFLGRRGGQTFGRGGKIVAAALATREASAARRSSKVRLRSLRSRRSGCFITRATSASHATSPSHVPTCSRRLGTTACLAWTGQIIILNQTPLLGKSS